MDIFTGTLRLVLFLLLHCKLKDCYRIACRGNLTVDQDITPIGSNLTVHCHSNTVQCGRVFVLKFNGKEVLREISCSSVTAQVVVNEPESWLSCAVEQEGKSYIVCGRDIMANSIPSTPQIKKIEFMKGSLSPTIHWYSSDNMENLKPSLKFLRMSTSSYWMDGNVTQVHKGTLVLLRKLEPLTSYKFKMKVCSTLLKYNCSLWSQLVKQSSPEKAPSTKLDVWRIIMRNEQRDTQNVTIMWKPLGPEDSTGVLHHYEIIYQVNSTTQTVNCSAAVTQYTLQLPLEVTELNVSAVTSAGSSPPASVRLKCIAGLPSPEINSSHAAGGGINLVWNQADFSDRTRAQMLGFVVQWQCTSRRVQWKRIPKNYNSVYIQATPPSLCIISLHVESSDGVSCPSFKHVHTTEKGTDTTSKQLGNYTVVPQSRIQKKKSSGADKTNDGFLVVICLTAVVPVIIIGNIMYLKCTRQRIRKACMSVGPSWLFQNLPKLGNSNAIRLLKDDRYGYDLCWQPVDGDPPLSPVEEYSPPVERKDPYPIVHKEVTTVDRTGVQDWTVCPYKPQITISQGAEAECEIAEKEEDEPPWVVFSPPVFDTFGQHFFPSHGLRAPLPSCLTVDGRPVSMDLVNGFPFFTQTALDGNMWTDNGNGDQNREQSQTVLPNNLVRCFREPFFNGRTPSPVQKSLHALQVDEQLL